jgi:hypothetical protein
MIFIHIKNPLLITFSCILFLIPSFLSANTWIEISDKFSNDNNVYTFYTPYSDSYQNMDFKINHKDKLNSSTHYSLNYSSCLSLYSQLVNKNTICHNLFASLEEDLNDNLVATFVGQGNLMNYAISTSPNYDYQYADIAASLKFFIFALDFTSIDWGLNYSIYNLPNYNFANQGFTSSLNFLEEVMEYNGFGTYLAIKQALPNSLDLDLEGRMTKKFCPERPLVDRVEFIGTTETVYYLAENRSDLDTSLSASLIYNFLKGSYAKLGGSLMQTNSNANAAVRNGATNRMEKISEYYTMQTTSIFINGIYCFGEESSYLWANCAYKKKQYNGRSAQNSSGVLLLEKRADQEINATVEFNQRLGILWGSSWTFKLGYAYSQNSTNDYFFNYTREIIYLGLGAYINL